jgi:hypothetical protein
MEKALSAYTPEHIEAYFETVKRNGLTEHGFPRLVANIGILIANGKSMRLKPLFLEMMELCCISIPKVKAANNFSVREIVSCIAELEKSGEVDSEAIERWKSYLANINYRQCYELTASSPDDKVKNWALFAAVSEFFRKKMGLGGSDEWIETQLATQLQWLDENGMYMDAEGDVHHPIMYDIVARGLFALLLRAGYNGRYYKEIDDCLRRSGLLTLKMQSPNGEIAFGGRSNQFLHNEPWLIVIFEYEASRYAKEGKIEQATVFKAAISRAIDVTEKWLSNLPIRHIKNRFPTETRFGCEEYAYFDKYMITVASNIYAAYLVSDESIGLSTLPDNTPAVFETSRHFHKLFVKAGGYGLEFDFNADPSYDASGLGRIHRAGAPSQICLSVPCPKRPAYEIGVQKNTALAMNVTVRYNGEWVSATNADTKYELIASSMSETAAYIAIRNVFAHGANVISEYKVDGSGVEIKVIGEEDVGYIFPVFYYDGEHYSEIILEGSTICILYEGWMCRYSVGGIISDTNLLSANRNGYYKVYNALGNREIKVKVEIIKL